MFQLTCIAKLKVMNSTIGFRPYIAAPTPRPVNPACDHISPCIRNQHAFFDTCGPTLDHSQIIDTRRTVGKAATEPKRHRRSCEPEERPDERGRTEAERTHTSVIGVSNTRSGPNFCNSPFVTCPTKSPSTGQTQLRSRPETTPPLHGWQGTQSSGTNHCIQSPANAKANGCTL